MPGATDLLAKATTEQHQPDCSPGAPVQALAAGTAGALFRQVLTTGVSVCQSNSTMGSTPTMRCHITAVRGVT